MVKSDGTMCYMVGFGGPVYKKDGTQMHPPTIELTVLVPYKIADQKT